MAGKTIDRVWVSITGGAQKSQIRLQKTHIASGAVSTRDINRLHKQDIDEQENQGRHVLHRLPLQYAIDGVKGIRAPLTMQGRTLSADIAVITAAASTIKNLTTVVERNHLKIERFAASTYVSGLSSLVEDEKDLGATIVDMGAGLTGIAIFMQGHLIYVDTIPVGGQHVTSDIARGLSTPLDEAERTKTLHGSVLAAIGESDDLITLPMVGFEPNDAPQKIELGLLGEIIRPRIEEIFEMLTQRLQKNGFAHAAGQRVVLVGGASQMPGMAHYVQTMFGRAVRHGKPLGITGMADATRGPAFSTAAGLLRFAAVEQQFEPRKEQNHPEKPGMLNRISQWFTTHI